MVEWDEGFIPKGWKRGDQLYLINGDFRNGRMACVARYVSLEDSLSAERVDDIFGVQFHYSQKDKVADWLDWWRV